MGLTKDTYKAGDNLTAGKVNDIQDAIIANEKSINNIIDTIGNIEVSLTEILDIQQDLIGGNLT